MDLSKSHPHTRPTLLRILHKRILAAKAPSWPNAELTRWAALVKERLAPLASAVRAHRDAEIQTGVADAGYRSAIRTACFCLHALKRALMKRGLTVAEVHAIIPDASSPPPGPSNDLGPPPDPELRHAS